MPSSRHAEYLANQIMAATPGELILLAYDGALRFTRMAREAMKSGDVKTQSKNLLRAQEVILQLLSALDSSADAALAYDLARIYVYMHGRLADANINSDLSAVEEVISLLLGLREAWAAAESEQHAPLEEAA